MIKAIHVHLFQPMPIKPKLGGLHPNPINLSEMFFVGRVKLAELC
jgi:hypothetical protein